MSELHSPHSALQRQVEGLSTLVQLEDEARNAETVSALSFIMANDTHHLAAYRQGFVWRCGPHQRPRLMTVSGAARFDRSTPMVQWLEDFGALVAQQGVEPRIWCAQDIPGKLRAGWGEWLAARALAIPVLQGDGVCCAMLMLARDPDWSDGEQVLLSRLAGAYGHAWRALEPNGPPVAMRLRDKVLHKRLAVAAGLALAGAMWLPVPQSALAPAEIVAADPAIVSAPMDGVVKSVAVAPNQRVEDGDVLFEIDDTRLRNRRDVAKRALEVAEARLELISKRAFLDADSRGQVAVLQAQAAERKAELAFTQEQLSQIVVRAPRGGVAVFRDRNDWIGRPVGTGERVMTVADPAAVKVRMDLPVDELLVFPEAARVQVFLNIAPLSPREAVLRASSYEAVPTPDGVLAYELIADLGDELSGEVPPRIGLKGTAKVYADDVSLFWYLMRKPIAGLRQVLGL